MRDFADRVVRPFSKAKDDDLVDLIRNIISGNINPENSEVNNPEEETEKEEKKTKVDAKLDGKSRAYRNAINRIATRKGKKTVETEEQLKEVTGVGVKDIALFLAENLSVKQLEELCTLLKPSYEVNSEE